MKLTLQLLLSLMRKRIFLMICSNSPSCNITHKVGVSAAMLPFQHNFFHGIQTPKVDYKHARMVEIGQHQIYQLIKLY